MQRKNRMSQDISIEEMLKSIRGIINTHKKAKADDDILELTELASTKTSDDNSLYKNLLNDTGEESLVSSSVINESIATIKNHIKNSKDNNYFEKKPSAEDLLIQLLKPQLKEWLDQNLPKLIEQLLEKEIKKLVPDENKIK